MADNGEWQTVMTEYLTIVARTLILDPIVFTQVLQEINVPNPLDVILDVWLTKMQLIVQSDKTKLMSLALSSLLTVQNDSVYKRFDVLMETICEALNDIMKEDNDDPNVMLEYVLNVCCAHKLTIISFYRLSFYKQKRNNFSINFYETKEHFLIHIAH